MATSLTGVGAVWASLSLLAAVLCCSGFYLPFWIQTDSWPMNRKKEAVRGRVLGQIEEEDLKNPPKVKTPGLPIEDSFVLGKLLNANGIDLGSNRAVDKAESQCEVQKEGKENELFLADVGNSVGLNRFWIFRKALTKAEVVVMLEGVANKGCSQAKHDSFLRANIIPVEGLTGAVVQGNLFNKVDAYFSSFRRCNYPRVSSAGVVEIIQECGRYSRFWDIPSPWWQASTILVGVASGLSLLVGVTAAAACCVSYVVHTGTARAAGFLQLCAALMVSSGVALYPIGWDNREIKESCGEAAHVYKIGNCNVSWSAYLLLGAVTLLLFCFGLSFCASRIKPGGSFRI